MLNILIPVDGSTSSLRAVEYVVQYRALHNEVLNVTLAHAQPRLSRYLTRFVPAGNVRIFQKERSDQALKDATAFLSNAGVEHQIRVGQGDVTDVIVACAKETGAQKIVMGTTRKNALARFFQGSVVSKVMALTDIPVEVVAKEDASKMERFGIPIGLGLTFLWLAVE